MTAKYFAILTNQGAAKLANATALGTKLNLTQMAVGDAGGQVPTPNPAQTSLIAEKRRAPLNQLSIDPANPGQIIAEQIIPENEGGWWIHEIGLYDDDGTLIAVANCPATYKPQLQEGSGRTQTIRMVVIVSNAEAVTLKIDPSVVLATREYADSQLKKHTEATNPHPQYLKAAAAFSELAELGGETVTNAIENLGLGDAAGYVGRFLNVQIFDTSSTYTPTAGTKKIIVEAIGGGGASGGVGATTTGRVSMSGCGTNGAYAKVLINTPSTAAVIVGAGGAGVINAGGNNGGTTSFGSYFSCPGGIGAGRGQSDMDPSNIYQAATNAAEAPQPTISKGIAIKTMTPSPTMSTTVSLGYGSALLTYPPFTHMGGNYGAGGNSAYITQNQPAKAGFSGGPGRVIVWEYA